MSSVGEAASASSKSPSFKPPLALRVNNSNTSGGAPLPGSQSQRAHQHHHHTRNMKVRREALLSPFKILTFCLWTVVLLCCFAMDIVLDIFQEDGRAAATTSSPSTSAALSKLQGTAAMIAGIAPHVQRVFPPALLYVVGTGLHALAAILMMLLGWGTKRRFHIFQPFVGGRRFVLLQIFGYNLVILTNVGKFILLGLLHYSFSYTEGSTFYGAFVVLGLFGLLGQLLLAGSISYFKPPPPPPPESDGASPSATGKQHFLRGLHLDWRHIAATPNMEIAFVITCNATMLCTSVVAELYPPFQTVNVFVLLLISSTALATVERIARAVVPRFHVYKPMFDTPALFAVQFLGMACLVLCDVGAVTLFRSAPEEAPAAWHLSCALLAVGGICVYLLEVRLVDIHVGEETAAKEGRSPLQPLNGGGGDPNAAAYPGNKPAPSLLMPKLASLVCIFMAVCLVTLLHFTNAMAADATTATIAPTASEEERKQWLGKSLVVGGLTQIVVLLMLLMLSLPIFTHLQGSVAYGDRFEVFQPFGGNVEFILLQCVGWASYGSAVFFATLALNATSTMRTLQLLLYTGTVILSQLCVHMSLLVFGASRFGQWAASPKNAKQEGENDEAGAKGTSFSGAVKCSECAESSGADAVFSPLATEPSYGNETLPVTSTVLNNEMLLAVVLGFVSISVRFVCDMLALYAPAAGGRHAAVGGRGLFASHDSVTTRDALVTAATVLCFLAAPVAQFSARDRLVLLRARTIPTTSMGYVAMQTFAWLLYITLFSFWVAMWCSSGKSRLTDFLTGGPRDTRALFGSLTYTCEGLLFVCPLLCLVVSIFFETEAVLLQRENASTALAAAAQLKRLIARKPELSEGEKRRAGEWLATILSTQGLSLPPEVAGQEGSSTSGDAGEAGRRRTEAEKRALQGAARSTTAILCLASTFSFGSATVLSSSLPVHTLVLALVGLAFLSLSCLFTHAVYGMQMHADTHCYRFFMPFMGGRKFVIYQTLGWMCFTVCWSLVIVSVLERQGSPLPFAMLTCSSIAAQVILHVSVSYFEAKEIQYEKSFVCRNAEGVLTASVLVATFFFARFYDMVKEGRASSQPTALVPLALGSIATCLAVPMGLLYLVRQAQQYGISPLTFFRDLEDDEEDGDFTRNTSRYEDLLYSPAGNAEGSFSPQRVPSSSFSWLAGMSRSASQLEMAQSPTLLSRAATATATPITTTARVHYTTRLLAIAFAGSFMVAAFVVGLLPFAGLLLAYAYAYQEAFSVVVAVRVAEILMALFFLLIVIPMLLVPVFRASRALHRVHDAICCFFCYSIPTFTVLSGVSPPFFSTTRGSWLFAVQMCSMALLSLLPYVHLIAFIVSCAAVGYFAQYHFYICLIQKKEPFMWMTCIGDMCCALFWAWYDRRYAGRPEITGRLYSKRASRFFKKYVFDGMVRYFSLRIVACEPHMTSSERALLKAQPREVEEAYMGKMKRVDLNDAANQYLFSFHPHGVFPGTSIYAPKTHLWEKVVGRNDKTIVTTHGADIIFSVPLMREFPLCLGALSVSRRGIEYSLRNGNSPLIVTGGQSEMLLTRRSNTEMHLVCHHLGFFRIALKNRVPLVPLLVFSESNIMDNVHCLSVQRWFLKRLAFPFPVLPLGRWHLPLPGNTPMMIVVGAPLFPLPGRESADDRACLEEMRVRYFEHIERLFYTHRAAAGYPDMNLFIHNGVVEEGVPAVPPPELVAVEETIKEAAKTLKKGESPKDLCKQLLDLPDSCWFRTLPSAVSRALSASPKHKKETEAHKEKVANAADATKKNA